MRIAVLAGGVPNPTSGGGALTAWSVVHALADRGHEVTVLPLVPPDDADPSGLGAGRRLEALRDAGVSVLPVPSRAGEAGAARSRSTDLFPTLVDAGAVREAVADVDPEVVFAYHFEGLAASRLVAAPRLAAVGDPPHLPAIYRWRAQPKSRGPRRVRAEIAVRRRARSQQRLSVALLRECDAAGAFAAHHAAELRRAGVAGCEYLRTPIPDPIGPAWRDERERRAAAAGRPAILLIGHLSGTVTLDGLRLFAGGILPRLDAALGRDGFEVRIVGGYEGPPSLREALSHPAVRFCGHTEDAREEFLRADVLLVPNAIPLGVRVRILSGFSYGCCVVSHAVNRLGIPELADRENALVGDSPERLAEAVLVALGDRQLRARLESGARGTYEQSFSLDAAGSRIEEILEGIARATRSR